MAVRGSSFLVLPIALLPPGRGTSPSPVAEETAAQVGGGGGRGADVAGATRTRAAAGEWEGGTVASPGPPSGRASRWRLPGEVPPEGVVVVRGGGFAGGASPPFRPRADRAPEGGPPLLELLTQRRAHLNRQPEGEGRLEGWGEQKDTNPTAGSGGQEGGIVGTLSQGIASLIKLPSQLTTKYFQSGDQHAEATEEKFSNVSHTFAAKQMEPTSGVQISKVGKKTNCCSSLHPDLDMITDSCRVKTGQRHDQVYGIKTNSKKNHNAPQEYLQPWSLVSRRHWLESSTLDTGRYMRKPHCTVEEGVQKEEREKYKQLLEQEKEKKSKNICCPVIAKHLDTERSLTETSGTSFETPSNGVRSIGPLRSRTEINSLMTVTERYSKSEKSVIQKTETGKQPLGNDLAEEVSLKLSLSQEQGSSRKCSPGESEEQKCQRVDKASEGFPALTEEMEREIANVLSHGEDDEILTSAFKLNITRGDIQTLKNQQWLNDVVINFYMNLLAERNKKPGFPNLYAFSTFFYPKLNFAGYNAVRRWTKEVDIFQYDMILVPIHIRVHWALVVIDMRRETITYFDSMGQNGYRVCMQLLQYLQEESKAKRNMDINAASWTLYSVKPHEIPQQLNGSDCGIFICKYADFISKDKPLAFTQCHMPYYRKRMVWEILHQQLL